MTKQTIAAALSALAALALATGALAADGPAAPTKTRVNFAKGASSATVKGALKGRGDIDYLVRAAAGQTLQVKFEAGKSSADFNVLPPGSADVAMYSSSMSGERTWSGMLPSDGDYAIRVYLGRAAARRGAATNFTLTVGITGKPLPPLSAKRDAKVAGTAYHATGSMPCALPYQPAVKTCEAGVVRRGNDGTATLEATSGPGLKRRILFVQGRPVVVDSMDALSATRQGDTTIVKIGQDERYDVPDAFLMGG